MGIVLALGCSACSIRYSSRGRTLPAACMIQKHFQKNESKEIARMLCADTKQLQSLGIAM